VIPSVRVNFDHKRNGGLIVIKLGLLESQNTFKKGLKRGVSASFLHSPPLNATIEG
jgi:hypothetical protein